MGALALCLAMVAPAVAAPPADQPAEWLRRPSLQELLSVWPREAWRRGEGGKATIECEVNTQGSLFDCKVLRESPTGSGFGAAALGLSPFFLMRPAMHDGKPAPGGGVVRIPISFISGGADTGSFIPGGDMLGSHKVVSDVLWTSAPSHADLVAAYPAKARRDAKGGRVTMDCTFNAASRFRRCEVLGEEPSGYGFGAAAQALSARFEGPPNPEGPDNFTGAHTPIAITFVPEMLDAKAPVIGKPKWAALPAGREFEQRFAPLARKAGVSSVRAILNCTVFAGGALGGCTASGEDPAGVGVGAAALELAPAFRLSIWTAEGIPVIGSAVQAPLRYKLPETPAAKP